MLFCFSLLLFISYCLISSRAYSHLVDTDTTKTSIRRNYDKKKLHLVMSDEFNSPGRSFGKGSDSLFEAVEKPDNSNEAIQFYNSSTEYVTTRDGSLVLTTRAVKTSWTEWDKDRLRPQQYTKNYTSGMIQTWNKFCFTGGVLEMGIDLPGDADSGGIWPAAWLMGNLARATWETSTTGVWPWSYNQCPEQKKTDQNKMIDDLWAKQEINACDGNPGFGMHPHQGRGAPEIDIFEVMPGHEMPGQDKIQAFMSSSLQISPGVPKNHHPPRPKNGDKLNGTQIWYADIHKGKGGVFNDGFWGQECGPEKDPSIGQIHKYMQDAISVNHFLNDTHFENHHAYKLEWQPGDNGYLYWYLDDELLLGIEGISIQQLTGAMIPEEPMYLILNTAISHRWGMPEPCDIANCPVCWHCYDCTNPECQCTLPNGMKNCKNLPAEMKIDYIRLYQDLEDPTHKLGCSTTTHPTEEFIAGHPQRYEDWSPLTKSSIDTYQTVILGAKILGLALLMTLIIHYCFLWKANSDEYSLIPDRDPVDRR